MENKEKAKTYKTDTGKATITKRSKMPPPMEETSHLCLTTETLKEIKDWTVGKTYDVTLKIKMVGRTQNEWTDDARFDVLSATSEDED